MNTQSTFHDTAGSGCSGAQNILQLFTAENFNSDGIYQLFCCTKFITISFISQILPVYVIDSDGSKCFL